MIVKARSQDMKEPDLYRHGDFAGAAALANYAALEVAGDTPRAKSRNRRVAASMMRGY